MVKGDWYKVKYYKCYVLVISLNYSLVLKGSAPHRPLNFTKRSIGQDMLDSIARRECTPTEMRLNLHRLRKNIM